MSSEVELVISVWDIVRDHLPNAKRTELAQQLLYAFVEYGFEESDLASIVDEDPELSDAFHVVFAPVEDKDEDQVEDDEERWW